MKDIVKEVGDGKKYVGTAVMPHLLEEEMYRSTILNHFNSIVVEHHQKWAPLCPKRGIYDFSDADKIVDFGKNNGLNVKGHTLIWNVLTPEWLRSLSDKEFIEEVRRHIYTTVGHFSGRVDSWDVVNEALATGAAGASGNSAENMFWERFGKSDVYIEQCFRWARLADSNCKLIYNDNKVEAAAPKLNNKELESEVNEYYEGPFYGKSDAMFNLIKRLKANGTPVGEVGLQAHFNASGTDLGRIPLPEMIAANVIRYRDLGVSVNISEMDIRIGKLEAQEEQERLAIQRDIYYDVTKACFRQDNFSGLTFWGFTDKYSWVHQFYAQDTPLLFNEQYDKKPAFTGVSEALKDCLQPIVKDNSLEDSFYRYKRWMPAEPKKKVCVENTAERGDRPDWEVEVLT